VLRSHASVEIQEEKSVGDDTKKEKSQMEIAMDIIMNDPEIAIAMLDSRVRTAFQEIQKDIKNAEKYKDDPKIGPLIDKVLSQLDLPDKKKSSPKKSPRKQPSPKKPPRKQPSTNVSKPVAKTVAKTVAPKQEPQGASQTPASVTSISEDEYYGSLFQVGDVPKASGGGGGKGVVSGSRITSRTGGGGSGGSTTSTSSGTGTRRGKRRQSDDNDNDNSANYDGYGDSDSDTDDVEPFDLYRKSYSDFF